MRQGNQRHAVFRKALLVTVVAAATPALAQEHSGSSAIEEVIVTAEHREASVQDTKISITALNAAAIADLGISNGLDIGEYVPNLNAQPYVGGRTGISFNIRGVGNSETLVTFDPAVSVYIDGVLISKNVGSLLDILELERIEVLRGPQGTLYGRNTIGGAINYITKKPTDEFEGSLRMTAGQFDLRDMRAMINVPLLGKGSDAGELNLRASIGTVQRDGITKNKGSTQGDLGTKDRDVAQLQLLWRPNEAFSALYSYDRTRIDEIPESPWVVTVRPGGPTSFLAAYDADEGERPDNISVNDLMRGDTEVDGHGLTLSWNITEHMTLQSLTGYRDMSNLGYADSDGSPFSVIATRDQQTAKSKSQEFRLTGSMMDERLGYSVGLFYYQEEGDLWNQTDVFGFPNSVNIADYDNEAKAVYGQFDYKLTDKLGLTVGIRYTEEDREMRKAFDTTISGFVSPILKLDAITPKYASKPACTVNTNGSLNCSNTRFPDASDDFNNTSGLISLSYNWTDDVMTYAKISSGYQSGGFNARDQDWRDFTTGFKEETLIAYELGLKSRFANRFQVNAAWFFSDYDDKRVNQFNPQTLVSVQVNAGVVEIWGVEVETLAQLTDSLSAGLNYGYVSPEYVEYDGYVPATMQIEDLSNTLYFPFAPKNNYSAFLAYQQPIEWGVVKARVDWSYRDNMNFLTPKPELNESEEANLWNARVGLEDIDGPHDTKIRVSAWVKNLFDEGYWNFGVNIYSTFGFDIDTYGEPRTWGVDFQVDF